MSDLFKDKAKDWDVNDTIKQLSLAVGKSMIENIEFKKNMQAMDFGAGTGLITSQIAQHVDQITAVDVSPAMLEQLSEKLSSHKNIKILCHDLTKNTLNEKYDLIVSAMAMHHVEDTDNILKQFSAILKNGAQIALADLDKEDGSFHPADIQGVYHQGFERDAFADKLKQHGFTDIKVTTAHQVPKNEKAYPVFLVTATKK